MNTGQPPEDVLIEEREPQPVLSIKQTVELARLTEAQGESLRELWSSVHPTRSKTRRPTVRPLPHLR
jgi:hypothetical protein